jgi:hypothetical protein
MYTQWKCEVCTYVDKKNICDEEAKLGPALETKLCSGTGKARRKLARLRKKQTVL